LKNCNLSCGVLYFSDEVVFVEEVESTGSGDGFVDIEEIFDGELDGSFDEVVVELDRDLSLYMVEGYLLNDGLARLLLGESDEGLSFICLVELLKGLTQCYFIHWLQYSCHVLSMSGWG